jgi:regulator of replication initiation timing
MNLGCGIVVLCIIGAGNSLNLTFVDTTSELANLKQEVSHIKQEVIYLKQENSNLTQEVGNLKLSMTVVNSTLNSALLRCRYFRIQ